MQPRISYSLLEKICGSEFSRIFVCLHYFYCKDGGEISQKIMSAHFDHGKLKLSIAAKLKSANHSRLLARWWGRLKIGRFRIICGVNRDVTSSLDYDEDERVKFVRFYCVVGVLMNRAPPLARSGGMGAMYWEEGGWVMMKEKKKKKKKKKKKEN